ncbi:hypothetical protein AERO8C_140039 [Aeromonas veronii]|uniref:Uncharacterized protein n=1 Tax=Aeromonas veronii TaxID=654 RepID=A0A653KUP9_AERVE|nr:hypothetical protein AERO8C_140039 [Aeromonas veronii]
MLAGLFAVGGLLVPLTNGSIGGTGAPEHLLDMGVDAEFHHQGIQLVAIDGGSQQHRRDLQIPLAKRLDVELAQGVVGLLQHLLEPVQHLLLMLARGQGRHLVGHFGVGIVHRAAVDLVDQRSQQGVGGEHEQGTQNGLHGQPCATGGADRRHTPQGGGGVDAADVAGFTHDDAGAEKADAGDDIGHHMDHVVVAAVQVIDALGQTDEQGGPYCDQHVGAKARGTLAVLALQPDQTAKHKGEQQAGQGVEQGDHVDLLPHLHGVLLPISAGLAQSMMKRREADGSGDDCADGQQKNKNAASRGASIIRCPDARRGRNKQGQRGWPLSLWLTQMSGQLSSGSQSMRGRSCQRTGCATPT